MIQRITLYIALGLVLSALDADFTHWAFWCVVGLFWASEHLTRLEIIEQLQAELTALRRKHQAQQHKDTEQ